MILITILIIILLLLCGIIYPKKLGTPNDLIGVQCETVYYT